MTHYKCFLFPKEEELWTVLLHLTCRYRFQEMHLLLMKQYNFYVGSWQILLDRKDTADSDHWDSHREHAVCSCPNDFTALCSRECVHLLGLWLVEWNVLFWFISFHIQTGSYLTSCTWTKCLTGVKIMRWGCPHKCCRT